MKYIEKRPSAKDNQIPTYILAVGIEEVKMLHSVIVSALKYTPRHFDTMPLRARMKNAEKELALIIKQQRLP